MKKHHHIIEARYDFTGQPRPTSYKIVPMKTQSISAILQAFIEKAKDDIRNTGKMPTVILPTDTRIADAFNADVISGNGNSAMLHDLELIEKILNLAN